MNLNILIFSLNGLACVCIFYILYKFYKMKKIIYSSAWATINLAFVVLLFKWLYVGWLLYGAKGLGLYVLIHELLTFIFAFVAAVGFGKFSEDMISSKKTVQQYLKSMSGDKMKKIEEGEKVL